MSGLLRPHDHSRARTPSAFPAPPPRPCSPPCPLPWPPPFPPLPPFPPSFLASAVCQAIPGWLSSTAAGTAINAVATPPSSGSLISFEDDSRRTTVIDLLRAKGLGRIVKAASILARPWLRDGKCGPGGQRSRGIRFRRPSWFAPRDAISAPEQTRYKAAPHSLAERGGRWMRATAAWSCASHANPASRRP